MSCAALEIAVLPTASPANAKFSCQRGTCSKTETAPVMAAAPARRADPGAQWYTHAISALEAESDAVFGPGHPERMALLGAASGAVGLADLAPQTSIAASADLPVFQVGD